MYKHVESLSLSLFQSQLDFYKKWTKVQGLWPNFVKND